jgi:uncharacterized protein (DUF2249 family)
VAADHALQQALVAEAVEAAFLAVALAGGSFSSAKRAANAASSSSGVPMPTKPEVAIVSPLRTRAAASAAVVSLSRMSRSLQQFKDRPIGAHHSARVAPSHTTVLDVSDLPFWRRLPSILQAFDQLAGGDAIELVVDIDPWPLRSYLEATREGSFEWEMLQDGPLRWRVRLSRRA